MASSGAQARGALSSGEVGSAAAMALAKVKRWNPFLKFGVPLISLTVLGSVALAHLQQGRYVCIFSFTPGLGYRVYKFAFPSLLFSH